MSVFTLANRAAGLLLPSRGLEPWLWNPCIECGCKPPVGCDYCTSEFDPPTLELQFDGTATPLTPWCTTLCGDHESFMMTASDPIGGSCGWTSGLVIGGPGCSGAVTIADAAAASLVSGVLNVTYYLQIQLPAFPPVSPNSHASWLHFRLESPPTDCTGWTDVDVPYIGQEHSIGGAYICDFDSDYTCGVTAV